MWAGNIELTMEEEEAIIVLEQGIQNLKCTEDSSMEEEILQEEEEEEDDDADKEEDTEEEDDDKGEEVWADDIVDIVDLQQDMSYSIETLWNSHKSKRAITIKTITHLSKSELIILTEDGCKYALGGKFEVPGGPRYKFYY
jgi:hypothetical protein